MFDMNNMNMGNMGDKMMNRFFRKVDGVVWDMMTGKIGVVTSEGICTISGEGEDAQIELNLIDQFGMAVPAFAQNTPVNSVAVGDLIYGDRKVKGWVIEVIEKETDAGKITKFRLMTPSGNSSMWTPPRVSMLGFDSGVMVLRSLMNMLPGGKTGLDSMTGMLMPMMMMGGDLDLDSIMPMMLFSQLGASGNGTDANPMMGNSMMQMMMMQQLMGGKSKSPKRKTAASNSSGFFDDM